MVRLYDGRYAVAWLTNGRSSIYKKVSGAVFTYPNSFLFAGWYSGSPSIPWEPYWVYASTKRCREPRRLFQMYVPVLSSVVCFWLNTICNTVNPKGLNSTWKEFWPSSQPALETVERQMHDRSSSLLVWGLGLRRFGLDFRLKLVPSLK